MLPAQTEAQFQELAQGVGNVKFVVGYDEVRSVWDWLLGSYEQPLYEQIREYDAYCRKVALNAVTVCVRADSGVAGAISLYVNDTVGCVGFVTQLAVHSEWRRKGVGTVLLMLGEEIARARGMQELRLRVAEDNAAGRAFYSSLGYGPVCLFTSDGGEGLLLGKSLR